MSVFDGLDTVLADVFSDLGLGAAMSHVSVEATGNYNTATGTYDAARAEAHAISPAVSSLTRELVEGVGVRVGDLKLTSPALQFATEPTAGDEILMGAETWAVLAVAKSQGGAVVLAYDLHCRKA